MTEQPIPPRVLALLDEAAGRRLRWRWAHDAEVSAGLREVQRRALLWRLSGDVGATDVADRDQAAASWLSTDQAARLLGVGPAAVRRALREGRLPGRRVGRTWLVAADAVAAYVTARTT